MTPDALPEASPPPSLASFAIRRPYFIVVICLMALILGVLCLVILPKDLLPPANFPAVQILSFYGGMPVEEVENTLSETFERYTGRAVGIEHQEARSIVGVSIVRNFFNESTDLNSAISQTTALVMSGLQRLPPGTMPPLILPFDPMASVPLTLVAVGGDFPEKDLVDVARYEVGTNVQAIPGAMVPTVMGGAERQILVYTDPKKLKKYNLSPLSVLDRVTKFNTFIPTGDVKIGKLDYQIMSNGLVSKIDEINDFPIRAENGTSVTVRQIGDAQDSHKIQTNIVMIDGKRQVYVPVYRQPGANSLQVVDEVKRTMEKLGRVLKGYTLKVVADQSTFIRHAIHSITEEALIGGGLAALLVFLFLGNPRATFGILLSLPLSLLTAFIGLKIVGQNFNAMTLGGLALSIGVLVDNSIVVLENISKKMATSDSPTQAAIAGAAEVSMPVLASTLATMVVFFPILFLTGVVRVLFGALAQSVIFAMVGSYLCSMLVIPLFSSKFLRNTSFDKLPAFFKIMQTGVQGLNTSYSRALSWALRHMALVLVSVVIFLGIGFSFAPRLGTELFPRADAGSFVLDVRLPSGTRIEETEAFAKRFEKRLREWILPSDLAMIITNAGVYYGYPSAFTPNSGAQDVFFNISLTQARKNSSQDYAKVIRREIAKEFPEVEMGVELGGLLTAAMNGGLRSPIDVQVHGIELKKIHEISEHLSGEFKNLKGAVDVRVQQRIDAPAITLDINRAKAGEMGLTLEEVVKNVVSAVSSSSTFNPTVWIDPKTGIDYLLGVQFKESEVNRFEDLANIPITGKYQDRSVPLKDIAKIGLTKVPSEVNQVNLESVMDVYMDAQDRDIGSLSREVAKIIERTPFPEGYSAEIRGEISEMNKSISTLGGGFVLASVLVYLILVIQFSSFLLPLIIMVTVPMGMAGIILMLFFSNTYFSIQAAIGAIFMIGIAVANGVLLIEFILHMAKERSDAELSTAIIEGASARLRPILMTSLASVLGLVPMAIGLGHGSEANIPLGRAVIGGQLVSVALTLFVVPILFRLFYKTKKSIGIDSIEANPLATRAALLLFLLLPCSAIAQVPRELSLREALDIAQKRDPRLEASALHAEVVEHNIEIAKSHYYPRIDVQAADSPGYPGSSSYLGVSGLMGSPFHVGLGVGAILTQDLYDFGRTRNEVIISERELASQKQQTEVTRYEVEQQVLMAYIDCALNRAQEEVWSEMIKEATRIENEILSFVDTGQTSVVERYLAENQKEQAITKEADYASREQTSSVRLAVLLSENDPIRCGTLSDVPVDLDLKKKTDNNPFFLKAQEEVRVAQAQLDRAKSDNWPQIMGVASAGYIQGSHAVDVQNYALGVGISIPIFNGFGTTEAIARSSVSIREKERMVAAAKQMVDEIQAKFVEIAQSATVRISHLQSEILIAHKAYQLAKKRYLSFRGTLVDLREALGNLERISTDLNVARADYLKSKGSEALLNGMR